MFVSKNFICIFKADPSNKDDVVDKMDDPCFLPPCPTWGICRPNTRKAVEKGSFIIFLGHYPNGDYLVKGLIRVGGKINYVDASKQFPNRKNTLIKQSDIILNTSVKIKDRKNRNIKKDIENEIERIKNRTGEYPEILTTIKYNNMNYVQGPEDDHELDNWKCRRIFNCQDRTILKCLKQQACKKESKFPSIKEYVVADYWYDVGKLRIPWLEICPESLKETKLKTRYNQHNHRSLNKKEIYEIKKKLEQITVDKSVKSQYKKFGT